jgi:chemotaxis signal transduction protein
MLEIPLRANRRIGHTAWPFLEFDVLGLKELTSSASQVRHVTRLSGNFSIAKAQRAVQGVFEVKIFSIRCIRRSCSGLARPEA